MLSTIEQAIEDFRAGKMIIIVDDEKSIRAALRDILEYENYEVDEAKDL